ncbi:ABC transporter permease, partial [Candidatus Saccharibacteria bacterium]|nr:ABC transporter permease [Candidatus Saccharibacteria bacterium]
MKNKALVFWTIAFPIILGTLFAIAFSDLESSNKTDVINIAVINNAELDKNQSFKNAINSLSVENDENQIFNTRYIDEESARRLLLEDEIIGFVELTDDGGLKVYIESNGIEQTILKSVTEEIGAMSKIIDDLAKREIEGQLSAGNYEVDYEKIYSDIIGKVQNQKAEVIDKSSEHLSYTMIEFYTLIAMACLFGGMLGAVTISQNLANMSNRGKRVAVSPAKKHILILSSALAGYSIQIVSLII